MADLLVYGSYGYTGNLVAEEALDRGLDVVLAGRDRTEVEDQSGRLRCEYRVASLDEPKDLEYAVDEVPVVVHCAGPFARTADPMVEACLRAGTHYLDITGEIEVFEALARTDERAREADTMVLPGVGFDVVPTDCLAAHLADRLEDPTSLALGFDAPSGLSPGTAKTVVENLGEGGAVRRNGRIESIPMASETRTIDFGEGERDAMAIPWGDVSTAYHTTGIGDVTVYQATHPRTITLLKAARYLSPVLGAGPVKSLLKSLVERRVEGPDAGERAGARTHVWGEVENAAGDRAVSRLETPHPYELTARTAVEVAERVASGVAKPGFQTPAGAYGADLILDVEGVERSDDPVEEADAD
ncbi:MAG: trans-acting enoyl reductase family protein [Haloarculaceae archaeon]